MSVTTSLVAAAIVALASALQGAVGFGFSLLAAPLLLLADPRLVPGPSLVALLVLALIQTKTDWRHIDRRGLRHALLGKVPGTVLGLVALASATPRTLGVVTGVSVLAAVVAARTRSSLQPTRWTLVSAGMLSGFTETTSSVGGPPVALVYRDAPLDVLRGTLAGYFVIGVTMSLASLTLAGHFTTADAQLSLPLLPAVPVGLLGARRLAKLLGARASVTVLVLCTASAALVLVRALA